MPPCTPGRAAVAAEQSDVYELFEHTADLGLRATATDLPALFAECGRGLLAILVRDPGTVRPAQEWSIDVPGESPEDLMVDWLGELLYRFDREGVLLCAFDVRIDSEGLHALARGERFDGTRHELEHEVKAVTYHALRVEQVGEGWRAVVVVDI